MWLEDILEAAIGAALVPHPNLPFGSLVSTRPALSPPPLPPIWSYNSEPSMRVNVLQRTA